MTIEWPVAIIIIVLIAAIGGVGPELVTRKSKNTHDAIEAEFGRQYQDMAQNYESLAQELREGQAKMQSDLAELRKKVDSMERMLKEVG
ncbi:MAG: hypothetical protein JW704_00330 [Anaerolineaceae bacterium]|nr:hypothetical protein [Anaerolineaceae bacterium]MBN2676691.1 hypothetical protein [Anaerolineaceae bacterium]